MSMKPELRDLAQLLMQATQQKSLAWEATVDPGTYRVLFDAGLVSLARTENANGVTFRLAYRNRGGVVVLDSGWVPEAGAGVLESLYHLIHAAFTEGAVHSLFTEIRQKLEGANAR